MKLIYFIFLFTFCISYTYTSQQEINREIRRENESKVRELEKTKSNEKVNLHEIKESDVALGAVLELVFIDGNTVFEDVKLYKISDKYIGKKGGYSIINLMKELENLYLQNGYISARVKINMEKSNLNRGVLFLQIIEGTIENIQFIEGIKMKNFKTFIAFPVEKGDIININRLDQGIDNLNSISSNNAKLSISPGNSLGGSIIDIENKKSKKISGAINYNNLGQESTGKNRVKFSLTFEDILGLNESFTGTYQRKLGETKYTDNEDFSFYLRVPIRYWDISLSRYQSEYLSSIKSFGHIYESTGISNNTIYSLGRILERDGNGKTSFRVSLTEKDTTNYFDGIRLISSSRKLSVLKTSLEHNRRILGGVLSGNLSYHEGLDRFGAKSDEGVGKFSPRAQFQKYTMDMSWYKPFKIKTRNFSYRFSISGQYSSDILYSSEAINIGDDTTVRGFKDNSSSGDKGFYFRNEIGYKRKFLEPFIGYDYGRVKSVFKDEYYKKNGNEMSGVTIGIRAYFKHLDMSLSYSEPVSAPSYIDKNTRELYLSFSTKY